MIDSTAALARSLEPRRGGFNEKRPKSALSKSSPSTRRPRCTPTSTRFSSPFYRMADDLLPRKPDNARRRFSDAGIVTLCVAQAIVAIPSDRRFLAVARKRLREWFPGLPAQPGHWKLLDSTPVECGRSRATVERSALADACGYGWCRSHSRYFSGMRLHARFGLDGTPRGAILWSPSGPSARSPWSSCRASFAAARRSSATRATRAPSSRPASCAPRGATCPGRPLDLGDPPAPGVRLSDAQGHPHARAPRRPHAGEPAGADRPAPAHPRCLRLRQLLARASEPLARRLHGVSGWNQSASAA